MAPSNMFGSLSNAGAAPKMGNPSARTMRVPSAPKTVQRQAFQSEPAAPAAPPMLDMLQKQLSSAAPAQQSPQMQAQKAYAQAVPRTPSSPEQAMQAMQAQRQRAAQPAADPRQMQMVQARNEGGMQQQTQLLADRQMRQPIPSSYAQADGRDPSAALAQQQMMPPEEEQMQAMPAAPQTPFAYPRESRQMMSPPQQGGNDQRARLLAQMAAQRDRAQFYGR